jgi:hypothetical protein
MRAGSGEEGFGRFGEFFEELEHGDDESLLIMLVERRGEGA